MEVLRMIVRFIPNTFRVPLVCNVIAGDCRISRFRRMIESVAPVCDLIVVVFDEKAKRELYEVADQHGCLIVTSPWRGDFAYQRNVALSLSRQYAARLGVLVYVVWMDTDETLRRDVASRLVSLMTAPRLKAFYLWQGSPSKDGRFILVPQVRVFPLLPGVQWELPLHEQILPSLLRIGVQTEVTDLRIEHSGYWNESEVVAKNRRNLEILRRRVQTDPEDAFSRQNYENALNYQRMGGLV
jgi:hypothetical protein